MRTLTDRGPVRRNVASKGLVRAGWILVAVSAATYATLVVRDRRRNIQWWVEHCHLAD